MTERQHQRNTRMSAPVRAALPEIDLGSADFAGIDDDACRRHQNPIELVGRRWSSAILLAIGRGARRFSEIVAAVPGLSDRMLSQRIKELESNLLLQREVIATTPVQIRYHLTERGLDLVVSMQPLAEWDRRWNRPAD